MRTYPRIHPAVIKLVTRHFNSHKKGLPEWLKNSREAYLRAGVQQDKRVIVIHYSNMGGEEYLECIDFVGISGDGIKDSYIEWANPDVAVRGLKPGEAEGGQGNGGKGYLREMFDKGFFISNCNNKLSVVSFTDPPDKYILDFWPDEETGKDSVSDNPKLKIRQYTEDWLNAFHLPINHNITIVRGVKPKNPIDPDRLLNDIQQHPHARETIRACNVSLYVNCEHKRDLKVIEPALHPMFPAPIRIQIPLTIKHPDDFNVRTTKDPTFKQGELVLCISEQPLHGAALSTWNRIDFHADGVSIIGHKKAEELPLQHAAYFKYLFGRCTLPLLKDPDDNYEMQGRVYLKDGDLSEALYHFIAEEADKYLIKLVKHATGERTLKKHKNLLKLHDFLKSWIEKKFSGIRGFAGAGDYLGDGKPDKKKREKKEHSPPIEIKIHRDKLDICAGVNYPLRAIGIDPSKMPVPPGKITWRSKESSIATVHPDKGVLEACAQGLTYITATNEMGLTSPPLIVMVHEAADITIKSPSPTTVGSNRRVPLQVSISTTSGKSAPKDTVVSWKTDDEQIATVGPDGNLVGGEVGETQVTAFAGIVVSDPLDIVVVKGAAGKPRGGGKGKPQILLSSLDKCPFDSLPFELDPNDPPVYQRPYKPDYDYNVFWINLQHPLAEELLKQGEGSIQWRTYHFQRFVDVYTQIELRNRYGDNQNLDVDTVIMEIQTIATELYKEVKEAEIFNVLYNDDVDIARIAV